MEEHFRIDKPSAKISLFQIFANNAQNDKFKAAEIALKIKAFMGSDSDNLDKSSILNKSANINKLDKSGLNSKEGNK